MDLFEEMLKHTYADKRLQKYVKICLRTKKKRIQKKMLNKLFYPFMEETKSKLTVKVVGEGKTFFTADILDFHLGKRKSA